MPGAHKIGAAISVPRIAGGNFMDMGIFLNNTWKTQGCIKTDGFQNCKFFDSFSLKLGILVPVRFGTRLGVSLAAPKGVSKRMGLKMPSFLSYENCEEKKPILKRRVQAPKGSPEFCITFGVLQEGSAELSHSKCLLRKGSAEPQRFCRTLGAKPSFSGPPLALVPVCFGTRLGSSKTCSAAKCLQDYATHCLKRKSLESEILAKSSPTRAKNAVKIGDMFRPFPSIPQEVSQKASTHSTRHQTKCLHRETRGPGGRKIAKQHLLASYLLCQIHRIPQSVHPRIGSYR